MMEHGGIDHKNMIKAYFELVDTLPIEQQYLANGMMGLIVLDYELKKEELDLGAKFGFIKQLKKAEAIYC